MGIYGCGYCYCRYILPVPEQKARRTEKVNKTSKRVDIRNIYEDIDTIFNKLITSKIDKYSCESTVNE